MVGTRGWIVDHGVRLHVHFCQPHLVVAGISYSCLYCIISSHEETVMRKITRNLVLACASDLDSNQWIWSHCLKITSYLIIHGAANSLTKTEARVTKKWSFSMLGCK